MSPEELYELALMGCGVLGLKVIGSMNGLPLVEVPPMNGEDVAGEPFDPTDLNQAWEVAAKVGTVRIEQDKGSSMTIAAIWSGPPTYRNAFTNAETPALALMKAVQAALSGGDQL